MKSLLISTLYIIAKQIFDKEFFDRVEGYVATLLDSELQGDEKRQKVREWIWDEWTDVKTSIIDTVIQITYLNFNRHIVS